MRPKWTIPDRLTPEFLHHMLEDLRRCAPAGRTPFVTTHMPPSPREQTTRWLYCVC